MRSVTYSMGVSVDGYIVGPDGGFDWTAPDEEVFRFVTDEIRQVDVHLLGRRLYETMLYWETVEQESLDDSDLELIAIWKPLPKVVFSTTLPAVQGNARLASGGLAEEIERLVHKALGCDRDETCSPEEALRKRVERVIVHTGRVEIIKVVTDNAAADADEIPASRTVVVMARLAHRNRARILDDGAAGPEPTLLRALGRAHEWRGWMERGEAESYRAIAKKAGVSSSYVQTILPLAFLAPSLTRELLDGRRQLRGPLMIRLRRGIPTDWHQQIDRL